MMGNEQLKEEYSREILELIASLKESAKRLNSEGSGDEAILESIKANVADIFYKMFQVSYTKTCKNLEPQAVELEHLKTVYYGFFEKIPASWVENMAKAKEHNIMEEYYKEEIKLETARIIKELFKEHFNRYKEEN